MTDKGPPDDDDERETLAGDTTAPIEQPTQDDFGDMVSLPGRRPTPRPPVPASPTPTPARRKLPDADVSFDDDHRPTTVPDELAPPRTEAAPGATEVPPSTETPTREIDVAREMPTIVGSFAASVPGEPDEAATIAEVPEGHTGPPMLKGTLGTDERARAAPSGWKSPLSKAASRTQRDPIVGSAASRGTHPGARPASSSSLSEGQLLADRYELVERLGKGGMGEVWKAKHILLQGMRAIKVIKASISMDPQFRQRFLQEGQTMMRVKHPGVVEVTDLDETRANRELFMVMEYLKGRTIYDAIRDKQMPLSADVRNAVRIIKEVAEGMQVIHDQRIVHKDLKSDNVLLVKDEKDGLEHPKVIDFGLAKRLGDKDAAPVDGGTTSPQQYDGDLHTTLSGTLAYMAPEQFRHEPSSFQSDIYALGVMAYEMFAGGEYPLPRGSLAHYLDLHKKGAVPDVLSKKRPDLDPKLTAIIDRCLAPAREARPESCREVVKDLKYWLDTPARLKLRNQIIAGASAAAALIAVTVWAIFFGSEKTASLSNLSLTAFGRPQPFQAVGKRIYLPGEALAALQLSADIAGKPGDAVLEVDDRERKAPSEVKDGRLVATVDVSEVPDGEHPLRWRASAGAAPILVVLDVDRVAPKAKAISVRGAVVGPAGVFTRAQSPEVIVELDESGSRISEVVATLAKSAAVKAQRDGDTDRWILKGTSNGDGPVELEVVARDLAGNESKSTFSYVRDTQTPVLTLGDYFQMPRTTAPKMLFVRQAAGSKAVVTVDEASDVTVSIGGSPGETKKVAAGQAAEFVLPSIKGNPEVVITAKDAAGNESEIRTPVTVVADIARLIAIDTTSKLVMKGDSEDTNPNSPDFLIFRTYPLESETRLSVRRLRSADGSLVDEPEKTLDLRVSHVTDEGHSFLYKLPRRSFQDGVYEISASMTGNPQIDPLELTWDSALPEIATLSVAQEDGRAVPEGGFALAQDLVVIATVADLSLEAVTLDGKTGTSAKGTYTFRRHLDSEGRATFTLAARDRAGHTTERTFTLTGDWSVPTLELTSPVGGSKVDDVRPVKFEGRCSEPAYTLLVEGFPDGSVRSANCDTAELVQSFVFPTVKEPTPVSLSVVARDPAGHLSQPIVVPLTVLHRGTDLPPEVTWRTSTTTLMDQVEPGDVVIGGRVQPVARVFVDKTEVTNASYRAFLAAGRAGHGPWCHADEPKTWDHAPSAVTWSDPKWNADDLPVVNVAWWDAFAFAGWTERRLPTEAEWVKAAAKAKDETELRSWPPFGPKDEWKNGVIVADAKGPSSATAGGDVSPVGCLNMGGNVSEWVDLPADGGGTRAGTRGGSWFYSRRAADIRNTPAKVWNDRSFRANTIGFRCAVNADKVQP